MFKRYLAYLMLTVSIGGTTLTASDLVDMRKDHENMKSALEYLISDFRAIKEEFRSIKEDSLRYKSLEERFSKQETNIKKVFVSLESFQHKSYEENIIKQREENEKTIEAFGKVEFKSRAFSYDKQDNNVGNVINIYLAGDTIEGKISNKNEKWICIVPLKEQTEECVLLDVVTVK